MDPRRGQRFSICYCSLQNKNMKTRIHGLKINGVWVTKLKEIKKEVRRFSSENFHEFWSDRPKFISSGFKKLYIDKNCFLESPFTTEEIKFVVWCFAGNKAPGPDGFTFRTSLSGRKAKSLSFGGRITLIKYVQLA